MEAPKTHELQKVHPFHSRQIIALRVAFSRGEFLEHGSYVNKSFFTPNEAEKSRKIHTARTQPPSNKT